MLPHVILFVSSTRGIAFLFQCLLIYDNIYMEKRADFYTGLYSQPGNLARTMLSYNFHAHFTSYEHNLSVHACIACDRS